MTTNIHIKSFGCSASFAEGEMLKDLLVKVAGKGAGAGAGAGTGSGVGTATVS